MKSAAKKLMKLRKEHKSKKVKKVKAPSVPPKDSASDTYAGLSSETDDGTKSPPPPSPPIRGWSRYRWLPNLSDWVPNRKVQKGPAREGKEEKGYSYDTYDWDFVWLLMQFSGYRLVQ